jgi:hypothetical protein
MYHRSGIERGILDKPAAYKRAIEGTQCPAEFPRSSVCKSFSRGD